MKQVQKLTSLIVETIVEATQKKQWHAFIDNSFGFISIATNWKELANDIEAVKTNPTLLQEVEQQAMAQLKQVDNELVKILVQHVWTIILFNTSATIAMVKDIKAFETKKK